jgi:hypothetical protein
VLGASALLFVSLVGAAFMANDAEVAGSSSPTLDASWADQGGVPANGSTSGTIRVGGDVPEGTDLVVTLGNATFGALPDPCEISVAKVRRSWITPDGRTLHCALKEADAPREVAFTAVADAGQTGGQTGGALTASAAIGDTALALPERTVTAGVLPEQRRMRLLSSPDFTNADIGDLTRGDADYDPATQVNGINDDYRTALDTVLDDWASKSPDEVTVAGDLVDGHWGEDVQGLKIFGPTKTLAQRQTAIHRAASVYYAQWKQRLAAHGLDTVHPAMGDHEYGDNDWPRGKLRLADTYRDAWASYFTKRPDGTPVYPDRPVGSINEYAAYAWRPRPDVQMVSLSEFTNGSGRMQLRIDDKQFAWLVGVLKKAKADGVPWIFVQGHIPILEPVRSGASSNLGYETAPGQRLWKQFAKYGVDLYLCGEVHDVTAIQKDGVLQVSHGGIFQYGRTNYLLADVYDSHLDLKIFDYTFEGVAEEKDRLWETRDGVPAHIHYDPDPDIIGTAQLWSDGRITRLSGALAPYTPDL